eukprot:Partr_v1_DN28050_c1_g1_i2_m56882 putative PPR repeat
MIRFFSSARPKLPLNMPDISSAKWSRRDKLNPINFANKGKRRILGPRKPANSTATVSSQEHLPVEKTLNVPIVYKRGEDRAPIFATSRPLISDRVEPLNRSLIESVASNDSECELNAAIARDLLEDEDNFASVTRYDYINVVRENARQGRFEEAQRAHDLMVSEGIAPSRLSLNALMDAYANASRLDKCVEIFGEMKSKYNIVPDSASFGIIIKVLTRNRKVTDAFAVYSEMKQMQVPVTQPIYSMLISGCAKIRDYGRAWKLFEHMRSISHRPDQTAFNQMISICSYTKQPERAMHLFREMTEMGLHPTASSYHTLISTLAKSAEHYQQTFEVVAQMRERGFPLEICTYNSMLFACSRTGDVVRARALHSELQESSQELKADRYTLTSLMLTYSRFPMVLNRVMGLIEWSKKMDKFHEQKFNADIGLENEKRVAEGLKPIDISEWLMNENYDPDEKFSVENAFGNSYADVKEYLLGDGTVEEALVAAKNEALSLCKPILSQTTDVKLPVPIDALQIRDRMVYDCALGVLGAYGMQDKMIELFDTGYQEAQITKNSYSYLQAIQCLVGTRFIWTSSANGELSETKYFERAMAYLSEYEKYRSLADYPETWTDIQTKYIGTRLAERGIGDEQRQHEYKIYLTLIQACVDYDDLYRAVSLLSTLIERGHARISTMPLPRYNALTSRLDGDESTLSELRPANSFNRHHFAALREKAKMNGTPALQLQISQLLQQAREQSERAKASSL